MREIEVKNIPISFSTVSKLRKYYKRIKPDIIHTHLGHADILGIWSARNIRRKSFCTMHNIYFKKNFLDAIFFEIYQILFLKVVKRGHIISISKSVENHVLKRLQIPKESLYIYYYNAIPKGNIVQ